MTQKSVTYYYDILHLYCVPTGASHDMITVGAFAVHPRGFKQGGLNRLLKPQSTYSSLVVKLNHLVSLCIISMGLVIL